MKKISLLVFLSFMTLLAGAQSKKIYVSRHGGARKLLCLGRISYNYYHFSNISGNCDTLICSGPGYEPCKIDKEIIKYSKESESIYLAYNKAIRMTEKHIRKIHASSGCFSTTINGYNLSVRYDHADSKGNADIEIDVL